MDDETFRALYNETARSLRGYLRHAVGNDSIADDLLQEAYFRMLRTTLPVGMDAVQMRNYLYKVATNLMRDLRAAPKLEPLLETLEARTGGESRNEDRDVRRAFLQLRQKERMLLWLAYVEGFTHQEIARLVGNAPASIRPLLARARASFRRILDQCGYGDTGAR